MSVGYVPILGCGIKGAVSRCRDAARRVEALRLAIANVKPDDYRRELWTRQMESEAHYAEVFARLTFAAAEGSP